MRCSEPLRTSLLMDYVPQHLRGRWNALEGLTMFTYSGSAMVGGYLIEHHGYRYCFLITAAIYGIGLLAELLLLPIIRNDPNPQRTSYIQSSNNAVCVLLRDQFSIRLWSPPVDAMLQAEQCRVTMAMDHLERYRRTAVFALGRDASLVLREPNAGGQSVVSEALSMEYMHQMFGAVDVVTEMQIQYWSSNWKKVDYICTMHGQRIAVSVTRAMKFHKNEPFTTADAQVLLRKKLHGLVVAKTGVCRAQRYVKSILHIWCQTKAIADTIATCYEAIVAELEIVDNVVLMATVALEDGIFDNNLALVEPQ
ncbi:hypothetical protein B5M09_010993 [Aphanomyces astaci]|uniref:Uncharacterized protein n=1 Tax=Aphanomyces astaci TaxID=112090 RepID=A0A3R7YGD3_APHAT|nr:hypothetical protein B5M09_010993 [Aphanomyces astaci]